MAADLRQGIAVSLLCHLLVVLMVTVRVVFFPSEPIDFRGAVRVDMVDLPDKLPDKAPKHTSEKAKEVKEISTPKKKTGKAIVDDTVPKVDLEKEKAQKEKQKKQAKQEQIKKRESKAQAALRELRAKAALEKLRQSTQTAKQPGPSKPVKYAGNVLAAGTQLTGLNAVQMDTFITDVDSHVKNHWVLPQWMANRTDLKARVIIKIDSRGFLQSVQLVSSSGDNRYDEIVMATVKKADPFPQPPDKFRDIVSIKGIELGFPE